jgi:hypothetical protein
MVEKLIKKWERMLTFENDLCPPLDLEDWQRHAEAYEHIEKEWWKFDHELTCFIIPYYRLFGEMPECGTHEKHGEYYTFKLPGTFNKKLVRYKIGILINREDEGFHSRGLTFLRDDGLNGDPEKYGEEPLIYINGLQSIRGGVGTYAMDTYLFAQGDSHRILKKERVVEQGADANSEFPCSDVYYTILYDSREINGKWVEGDIILKNRKVYGDDKKLIICEDVI